MDHASVAVPRVDQVDDHVGLRAQPHRGTDQLLEVDAVRPTAESELDALVLDALAQDPVGDSGLNQVTSRASFKNADPLRRLDLAPGAGVDDDRLNSRAPEQVRQHQTGWTGTDDSDGNRFHGVDRGVGHGIS